MDNNNGNFNNIDVYANQSGGNVYPILPPDQNIPSQPQPQISIPTAPLQQPSQPQIQPQQLQPSQPQVQMPVQPQQLQPSQPQVQMPVQPQQLQPSQPQVQIPVQPQQLFQPPSSPQGQVPVQPQYQYYTQNSVLASPSNPPPSYNEVVTDPVLLEEKFHPHSPNETEAYVDNDPYALSPGEKIPRHSILVKCPHCGKRVDSKISFENNDLTWGCCIILWCITCIFCFLPICLNTLKDCVHFCPECKREIARNKP